MQIFDDLTDCKAFNAQQAVEYGLIDRIPKPARQSNTTGRKVKTAPGLG
jgi:ATP-dependent protease ClpP protease subunit